jgi:hypothetical protein
MFLIVSGGCAGAEMISVVVPVKPAIVAAITEEPTLPPIATPALLIVATDPLLECVPFA